MKRAFVGAGALLFACVERGEVLSTALIHGGDAGGLAGSGDGAGGAGQAEHPEPDLVISGVAVGMSHSAAISSGALYVWGENDMGELGLGDMTDRHVPTALTAAQTFVSVSAGSDYTCALDDAGAVYCFGANDRGQLGQGDRTARDVPTRVPLPVAARVVSNNFEHVCALLADASLYCWGQNFEGELGQDDNSPGSNQDDTAVDILSPVQVPGTDWNDVSAGDGVTCGVRFDGTLWCWGRNSGHQLAQSASAPIQIRHPVQVGSDSDWLRVNSGQQFSFALKQDHSLWSWGTNVGSPSDGSPLGVADAELDTPTRLGAASDWVAFATRVFHTCAVNRQNELWCWGRNIEGQLGLSDLELRTTPTHVADGIAAVAVSWFTTCALTTAGHVLCTGANDHGQIGDGTTNRPEQFTDVTPAAP
jgi:alpha-tubulin suppressor-like RCC1 family protein